tara:strand:+ start:392 stop:1345 length:954 start_codon:yes stop_codon:yes gene_type:complete
MQYRFYNSLFCITGSIICSASLQAELIAGWDFSNIVRGSLTGNYGSTLTANYSHSNGAPGIGEAGGHGLLSFAETGAALQTTERTLEAGRNTWRKNDYPGLGEMARFDDYEAQERAGMSRQNPRAILVTEETSFTALINLHLYDLDNPPTTDVRYNSLSFGARGVGGRSRISVQIAHSGDFNNVHFDREADYIPVGQSNDVLFSESTDASRTGYTYLNDSEEKEIEFLGLHEALLRSAANEEDPLYGFDRSPLLLRFTVELDIGAQLILDNIAVTGNIPEPAECALYFGGIALLGLIARRRRQRRSLSGSPCLRASV